MRHMFSHPQQIGHSISNNCRVKPHSITQLHQKLTSNHQILRVTLTHTSPSYGAKKTYPHTITHHKAHKS